MRVFFAVELSEPLREQVGRVQSLLRPAGANVRWVRPGGAHFTLKFLGDVGPGDLPALDRAATPAADGSSHLEVRVSGLGSFPEDDRRPPRVVWAGVDGELEPLRALHADLEGRLEAEGFAREGRRYRPHVTLGRVRGRRGIGELRRLLQENRDLELGTMRVEEIVLLRSHTRPDGAHYERLQGYPLNGSPDAEPRTG